MGFYEEFKIEKMLLLRLLFQVFFSFLNIPYYLILHVVILLFYLQRLSMFYSTVHQSLYYSMFGVHMQ